MKRPVVLNGVALALDAAAMVLGLVTAHRGFGLLRPVVHQMFVPTWVDLALPNAFMPSGLVLGVAWIVLMRGVGLYEPGRASSSARIAAAVTRAALLLVATGMFIEFLLVDRAFSRPLMLLHAAVTGGWTIVLRVALLHLQRLIPLDPEPVLVVGTDEAAWALTERFRSPSAGDFRVVGYLRPHSDDITVPGILGSIDDLVRVVNDHDVRYLVLATRALSQVEAFSIATRADQLGLRVLQIPLNWGIATPRLALFRLADLELIDLTTLAYPSLAEQTKRTVDLVLTLVGGALILPLLLVVAVVIKGQDRGPVLFVQPRAGRGGRRFPFYKFRSMVVDAEAQRDALQARNEADGVLFKLTDDPRITPFGRWIRKTSIDELPQLLNVLRGDMNLVGPRPLPLRDLEGITRDPELSYWFEMRSKVKPGITGLWQVSGRSDLGMREMVQHDIDYIQNWSLWLDLVILLKTFPAVLRGRGAR